MPNIKGRYSRIEISLDDVENDKELHLTGDYLNIITITGDGSCQVRIDHRHAQLIDLREISEFSGEFERLYFTTDGGGGTCVFFVGIGMSVHVSPDPQKKRNAGVASTQITTSVTVVQSLANDSYILNNVTILNTNGIYPCYVGPYNANPTTFRAYAYILLPHKTLKFAIADMAALATVSYEYYNVKLAIIGTYE